MNQYQHPSKNDKTDENTRDEANKRKFVAPPGVLAQDLPGGGRDNVETDTGKEGSRTHTNQHGGCGESNNEGGVRGDPKMSDADRHGGRGRN
jgi:hypothetical protein